VFGFVLFVLCVICVYCCFVSHSKPPLPHSQVVAHEELEPHVELLRVRVRLGLTRVHGLPSGICIYGTYIVCLICVWFSVICGMCVMCVYTYI